MKKVIFLIAVIAVASACSSMSKSDRALRDEVRRDPMREARREARTLESAGWHVAPGSLPLSRIVEDAWIKQVETTDTGQPKYLVADGNGVAESRSVAEMQAVELGKLSLAGMLETNVNSLVSANLANAQLSTAEAASVTEVVQAAKNVIAVELGYVNPVFKIYKNLPGNIVEVQVRLFYDVTQSMEIAKRVIRGELKDKLKMTEDQLSKLMGI
jgi:hypothetical protein